MVTAELAACLPVLAVLVAAGVAAQDVAQARVRCLDAAREAARSLARGDSSGVALRLAQAAAGRMVSLRTSNVNDLTTVTLTMKLRPVTWIRPINIVESAVAITESDLAAP